MDLRARKTRLMRSALRSMARPYENLKGMNLFYLREVVGVKLLTGDKKRSLLGTQDKIGSQAEVCPAEAVEVIELGRDARRDPKLCDFYLFFRFHDFVVKDLEARPMLSVSVLRAHEREYSLWQSKEQEAFR